MPESSEQPTAWQWVPESQFEVPPTPTTIAIKRWWLSLQAKLQSADDEEAEAPQSSDAVNVNMQKGLVALDKRLSPWLDDTDDSSIKWIICPPHAGVDVIARDFCQQHSLQVLSPPPRDELTLDALDLALGEENSTTGWYIPELAHGFIRQSKGLRWVRHFFTKAMSGELGKGVVICDSWAWSFLQTLWPTGHLDTLTLQAFSAQQLTQLGFEKEQEHLQHLASLSRGNLGIVSAYAERRFRRQASHPGAQQSRFEMPSMPAEATDYTAFVLHMLLIHQGLSLRQLRQVLPIISPSQLDVELYSLRSSGLVALTDEVWRVTAIGYPTVRQALKSRGLWLDRF